MGADYLQGLHLESTDAQAVEALIASGNTRQVQGEFTEAAAYYRRALAIEPQHTWALNNLGQVLLELRRFADAESCLREALRLDPRLAQAHINLGNTFKEQRQLAAAAGCHKTAIQIDPRQTTAWIGLGNALDEQGKARKAVACYRFALRLKPNDADAHHNLGNVLARLGLFADAAAHNELALRECPTHVPSLWQRAQMRLLQGDFAGGWPEYEQRWALVSSKPPSFHELRWDGAPLQGRTIVVFADQGLGDTIQFIRYLPMVAQRGGRVIFECQPALLPLMKDIAGADQIVASGTPLPPHQFKMPLLSLPGVFGTTLETVLAPIPYLRADPALVEFWRNELASLDGLKIGIAWQGNPKPSGDCYRSFPMNCFEAIASLPSARLVSLQKGHGAEQLRSFVGRISNPSEIRDQAGRIGNPSYEILDLSDRIDNSGAFLDSAAVMMNLDLVITVDSALAHLAGALGVPVWVALPVAPDWRWLLEREDCPWYPTMRLFRQKRFGEWSEVFERMAERVKSSQF